MANLTLKRISSAPSPATSRSDELVLHPSKLKSSKSHFSLKINDYFGITMTTTYSPHHDGGGTLHLPSPTHLPHSESAGCLAQLRRSLSKSPSKHQAFRLFTSKSASPSPSSPLSPQSARAIVVNLPDVENYPVSSPLAGTFPPEASAKKPRPPMRRLSPIGSAFSRDVERSPARRAALRESSDNGNATPQSSLSSAGGTENEASPCPTPASTHSTSKENFKPSNERFDQYLVPDVLRTRKDRPTVGFSDVVARSSPLKRRDGGGDRELNTMGASPMKRRSIQIPPLNSDFDIFDQGVPQCARMERSVSDDMSTESPTRSEVDSASTPMPKRTQSLRKTTLQQRHDKPIYPRIRPNASVAQEMQTPGLLGAKNRPRLSLDNPVPHPSRGSPFSNVGALPSASVHPLHNASRDSSEETSNASARHPLSRTLTTSSASSFVDDSPTHIPVRHIEPTPKHDFSKSLPLGAARPVPQAPPAEASSQETDFATPENYKFAKPQPHAFMSTGLISKRTKDIIPEQFDFNGSLGHMPDTPCKRSVNVPPTPNVRVQKTQNGRPFSYVFGTPSTPFHAPTATPAPRASSRGPIFGNSFYNGNAARRGSFAANDGSGSPVGPLPMFSGSQPMVPPTPTKQPNANDQFDSPEVDMLDAVDPESPVLDFHSKFPVGASPTANLSPTSESGGCKGGAAGMGSPSTALRFRSFGSIPSFSSNRFNVLGRSRAHAPQKSLSIPVVSTRNRIAKPSPLSPASPIMERHSGRAMPQTPSESGPHHAMVPPDPSRLSISGPRADAGKPPPSLSRSSSALHSSVLFPPATPTAPRDSLGRPAPNISVTPVHNHYGGPPVDVDRALTARFDRVELVGHGEFSQVFRVARAADPSASPAEPSYFAAPLSSLPHARPVSSRSRARSGSVANLRARGEQVWAVKRTRHVFWGPRDRRRKLQEVDMLRRLGEDDEAAMHTLRLFCSWEEAGHLYIQTEYCDEGSLDAFLDRAGRQWRIDDFRIWKIMLELFMVCLILYPTDLTYGWGWTPDTTLQGLQHIHNSAIIHLDLKPANILISFEGTLKIADFGLASPWPAPPGTEGEGDREYIGPEILEGVFDKPADVFALGLILLEIAANVMLPDNGASWRKLRSGDMSDVPSLTGSADTAVTRDDEGNPIGPLPDSGEIYPRITPIAAVPSSSHGNGKAPAPVEVAAPAPAGVGTVATSAPRPAFTVDPNHESALDALVRWMLQPQPEDRPVVAQLLETEGVSWARSRRRAGATVYEGTWGPADEVLASDSEMMMVDT